MTVPVQCAPDSRAHYDRSNLPPLEFPILLEEVRRTRKGVFISFDLVVIPFNPNGNHWAFILVDTAERVLTYYDSICSYREVVGESFLRTVRRYECILITIVLCDAVLTPRTFR